MIPVSGPISPGGREQDEFDMNGYPKKVTGDLQTSLFTVVWKTETRKKDVGRDGFNGKRYS